MQDDAPAVILLVFYPDQHIASTNIKTFYFISAYNMHAKLRKKMHEKKSNQRHTMQFFPSVFASFKCTHTTFASQISMSTSAFAQISHNSSTLPCFPIPQHTASPETFSKKKLTNFRIDCATLSKLKTTHLEVIVIITIGERHRGSGRELSLVLLHQGEVDLSLRRGQGGGLDELDGVVASHLAGDPDERLLEVVVHLLEGKSNGQTVSA